MWESADPEPVEHGLEALAYRAEARYRVLVEQLPAITFMAALDKGVNELYVSPQIEQILGYTQKEWLEDPVLWYTRLHPDDRGRWHTEFARTCATGERFCAEYRFLARDGRVVWVQGEAQVVRDPHGQPLFLQGIAFDVTVRKQAEAALQRSQQELEEIVRKRTGELTVAVQALHTEIGERERAEASVRDREARLRSIVETAVDGIVVTDDRGLIETFNPAAELMFGYAADEVLGRNVSLLMPPPDREGDRQRDGDRAADRQRPGGRRPAQERDHVPHRPGRQPDEPARPPQVHGHRPRRHGAEAGRGKPGPGP